MCVTFFSQLSFEFKTNEKIIFKDFLMLLRIFEGSNISNINVNIHKTKTPPHLLRDSINLRKGFSYEINLDVSHEILLPFPYKTDCINYDSYSGIKNAPKSQEDCITKYMMKKEFKQCKCHYKWYYSSNNFINTTFCMNNNCRIKLETSILKNICKRNCVNRYYTKSIRQKEILPTSMKLVHVIITKEFDDDMIYTHIPKIDLIEYLCSIASLFSMWFGITLIQLAKQSFTKILFIIDSILLRIGVNFNPLIYFRAKTKFYTAFVLLFELIFFYLMSYQVKKVIVNFLNEETITRLSIKQIKTLPNLNIDLYFSIEQIYRKIEHHFIRESQIINSKKDDHEKMMLKSQICYVFFRKMLNERKFEEFKTYSSYENLIKSCEIQIGNNKIDCPKPQIKLYSSLIHNSYFYFCNLNDSFKQLLHNMNIENNLEKISFEFSNTSN